MFSKATLTSLAIGALYVNALTIPIARNPSPEPEFQDVEARIAPIIGAGLAGLSGLAAGLFKPKSKREAEAETEELDARVLPIPALAAGLTGIAAGAPLIPLLKRPKREAEPETEELETRLAPLILPGLAAAASLAPLIPGFPKPKRELSDELFSREPQVEGEQELDARAIPLPAITAGLAGLSSITPLIPSFVNRPKRGLSDDLFSREAQDWAQWAEAARDQASKREPSPEPQTGRMGVSPFVRRPGTAFRP